MSSLVFPSIGDRISIDTLTMTSSPVVSNVWKRRIVVGGLALTIFMGTAAIAAGTGSLLSIAGTRLVAAAGTNQALSAYVVKNIGVGMIYAGKGLFLSGKYAFLSVAVPVYTAGWVFPKWIITKGAPEALLLANKHVLIPICNGILKASAYLKDVIIRVAQTIYDKILIPLMEQSWKWMLWSWSNVVIPALEGVTQVVKFIAEKVLKPFLAYSIKSLERVWNAVVLPVATKIVDALSVFKELLANTAQVVYNYALVPIVKATSQFIRWNWNTIIVPSFNLVKTTSQAIFEKCIVPLACTSAQFLKWSWNSVVIPIVNGIMNRAHSFNQFAVNVAQAIYDYLLLPVGNKILECHSFIIHYGGILYDWTTDAVSNIFQAVLINSQSAIESVQNTFNRLDLLHNL